MQFDYMHAYFNWFDIKWMYYFRNIRKLPLSFVIIKSELFNTLLSTQQQKDLLKMLLFVTTDFLWHCSFLKMEFNVGIVELNEWLIHTDVIMFR